MRTIIIACILTIFLFMINSEFITSNVNANDNTTEIELINFDDYEYYQHANVKPGENNTVIFSGIINGSCFIDKNITKIICYLEAKIEQNWYDRFDGEENTDTNWSIKIIPSMIELEPDEQKEFNVIVSVPWGTTYNSWGNVTVFGMALTMPDDNNYEIKNITGTVGINQYYEWVARSEITSKTIKKGDSTIFTVNITNLGNGFDVFSLQMRNFKKLVKSEIECRLNSYYIEIDEKSSKEIEIIIKTSKNTPEGKYYFDFHSLPDGSIVSPYYEMYLEDPDYHIKFELIIEPDFKDKYFVPSLLVLIIIIILIIVKIAVTNKKNKK